MTRSVNLFDIKKKEERHKEIVRKKNCNKINDYYWFIVVTIRKMIFNCKEIFFDKFDIKCFCILFVFDDFRELSLIIVVDHFLIESIAYN